MTESIETSFYETTKSHIMVREYEGGMRAIHYCLCSHFETLKDDVPPAACDVVIPVYRSADEAALDGWTYIKDTGWLCPECSRVPRGLYR